MIDQQSAGYEQFERKALALEEARRLEEARDAFDAALRLQPDARTAAEGRARVAMALAEPDAVRHCQRALAFHQDNPEREFRMISTVASQLGGGAMPLFEDYVRRHPGHAPAHELLSGLRAEAGAGEAFLDNYLEALRVQPNNKRLLLSYWDMMSRSGREEEALRLMEAREAQFDGDRDFAMLVVGIAKHVGRAELAARFLEGLDDALDVRLARGHVQLLLGRPDEAARLLEPIVEANPGNLSAWARIEPAWRVLGDPRHHWLVGQPGLYGPSALGLDAAQLASIADRLRDLHQASAQPVGQSVRGGTQTPGQLLNRHEPEIRLLHDALAEAIRTFVGGLPDEDPRHPLLRHRYSGLAFGPSWSVRLAAQGHHSIHFHPNGVLSSACYISVPEGLGDPDAQEGWLEVGRPPAELGLDLEPLASFEPRAGRLVLFPSFLFHGTRPFPQGERLSVAFDLVPVSAG